MFTVKMVARPDARMVEVPLEIEAELPRDFEGAALLSSSGLPRKVKIKAQRDALKLSTAYRVDQLLADVVRTVLRGSPIDIERVQIAAKNFVRAVRERRQDGATLTVESNGRGRIQVKEAMPPPREQRSATAAAKRVPEGTVTDRITALERRLDQLEAKLARGAPADGADRVPALEKRIVALEERPAGAAVGEPRRGVLKGRGTAIEPFAEGLRTELRDRVAVHRNQAQEAAARCDKAAALAVEAERVLGAPREGLSQQLLAVAAQVGARVQALERVHGEVELYAASDLPLAELLVARLVEGPLPQDPAGTLERQAQALVRATRKGNPELRAWLSRAAALCGWELIDPSAGEPLSPQLHVAVDSGGDRVAFVAAPGVRRKDGSILCRARVLMAAELRAAEASASSSAEEVELLASEFNEDEARPNDRTPPPIDDRTPTQPLAKPVAPAPAIGPTQRLATPTPPAAPAEAPLVQPAPNPPSAEAPPPPISAAAPPPAEPVVETTTAAPAAENTATRPETAPKADPDSENGLPFALPDRDASAAEPSAASGADAAASVEPSAPDAEVTRPQTPPPAANGADDLALATVVAAAVETETDEDPEWALLARGPDAFAPEGGGNPSPKPTEGQKPPESQGPQE